MWPLVGPVTAAARDGDLRVMGVPVRPVDGADPCRPAGWPPCRRENRVAVSGLWRGGAVVAPRLGPDDGGPRPGGRPSWFPGRTVPDPRATHRGSLGSAGTALAEPVPAGLSAAPAGGFWQVAGRWTGNGLSVESARPGRPLIEAGPLRQVSVEGYLTATQDGAWAVERAGRADRRRRAGSIPWLRAGRSSWGLWTTSSGSPTGIPLPEAHDARVQALEAIGDGLAPSGERGAERPVDRISRGWDRDPPLRGLSSGECRNPKGRAPP